jgi:hypothetical protein
VAPALMLVVPRERRMWLEYAAGPADVLGRGLTLGALAFLAWPFLGRRSGARSATPAPLGLVAILDRAEHDRPPLRWGWLVQGGVLAALCAARWLA